MRQVDTLSAHSRQRRGLGLRTDRCAELVQGRAERLETLRDLVLGRFDPAPAGLLDAGHLRWFTRPFLAECLDEAGWRVDSIAAVEGAAAPDAAGFLQSLAGWPEFDPTLLSVYQWIAVGTA